MGSTVRESITVHVVLGRLDSGIAGRRGCEVSGRIYTPHALVRVFPGDAGGDILHCLVAIRPESGEPQSVVHIDRRKICTDVQGNERSRHQDSFGDFLTSFLDVLRGRRTGRRWTGTSSTFGSTRRRRSSDGRRRSALRSSCSEDRLRFRLRNSRGEDRVRFTLWKSGGGRWHRSYGSDR